MTKLLLASLLLLPSVQAAAEDLSLPFHGRWFVLHAGDTLNVNNHMSLPAQAYGVDFMKVGGPGGRALGQANASRVEDFFSWDEAVLAPAAGTVVSVVDGQPDNPLGSTDPENPAGNYVVIRTKGGRFVYVAHFRQGTIAVAAGDRVRSGQPLGRAGNSGNSDFPHVHLHIQDTPILNQGIGQNPIFGPIDVELTGKRFDAVTWPLIRGLFVSNPASD